jgi:CubicO group peptidase (beta-lactamase class C family)
MFAACSIVIAAPALAVPAGLDRKADAILAANLEANGPGATALVAEKGRIVWMGARGKADLAQGTGLKPTDLFRFASITKQFTAALTLRLVDEGRLSLDDTLGKLLPAETPASWHAVTVRQLLNHTSGIPSYTGKPSFMVEATTARPFTTQQLIDVTRADPMDFAPGTSWSYNNTGYVLLSAIAEKLTGKPWHVALREKITGPLGLTSIRCGCEPGARVTNGYGDGGKLAQAIDMSVPSGAGALVGNASDLARWMSALHGGKVLRPATYQAMITPQGSAASAPMKYGFGLARGELRGFPTIEHGGDIFGFSTDSIYLPARKLAVVVLGNAERGVNDPEMISRRLLAEAAGVPFPVLRAQPADLAALEPFFGVYRNLEGTERRFFAKDGKLYMHRVGGSASEVFAAGADRFFYGPKSLTYFDLKRAEDGKPALAMHLNGAEKGEIGFYAGPVSANAPEAVLSPAQLDRLVGNYVFGPATLTLAREGGGLTAQLTGQRPIPLRASGSTEFQTVGVDARLVFEEAEGTVAALVLHQKGRTLRFERR